MFVAVDLADVEVHDRPNQAPESLVGDLANAELHLRNPRRNVGLISHEALKESRLRPDKERRLARLQVRDLLFSSLFDRLFCLPLRFPTNCEDQKDSNSK